MEDYFIEVEGKYIAPSRALDDRHDGGYVSRHQDEHGRNLARHRFHNLGIIESITDKTPHPLENTSNFYYNSNQKAEQFSGLSFVLHVLSRVKEVNDTKNFLDSKKLDELTKNIETIHRDKVAFFETYGEYSQSVKRQNISHLDVKKLNAIVLDPSAYEERYQKLNAQAKKAQQSFKALLSPYLVEIFLYSGNWGFQPQKSHHMSVSNFSCFFPLIRDSVAKTAILNKAVELHANKLDFFELSKTVEDQNSKKNLSGYALYYNRSESAEGFLSNNRDLTKSVLEAKIFSSEDQATGFAERKSQESYMVVELEFKFKKVAHQKNCTPGPVMDSMTARREAQELDDFLSQNKRAQTPEHELQSPNSSLAEAAKKKSRKI